MFPFDWYCCPVAAAKGGGRTGRPRGGGGRGGAAGSGTGRLRSGAGV